MLCFSLLAITKVEDLSNKVAAYISEINMFIMRLLKEIQKLQLQIQEFEEEFDEESGFNEARAINLLYRDDALIL